MDARSNNPGSSTLLPSDPGPLTHLTASDQVAAATTAPTAMPAPPTTSSLPALNGAKRNHSDMDSDGEDSEQPCMRLRPESDDASSRLAKVSTELIDQIVSPFLREQITTTQATAQDNEPVPAEQSALKEEPMNQGLIPIPKRRFYCYRHGPDSKYARAADEQVMDTIQSVSLSPTDEIMIPITKNQQELEIASTQ